MKKLALIFFVFISFIGKSQTTDTLFQNYNIGWSQLISVDGWFMSDTLIMHTSDSMQISYAQSDPIIFNADSIKIQYKAVLFDTNFYFRIRIFNDSIPYGEIYYNDFFIHNSDTVFNDTRTIQNIIYNQIYSFSFYLMCSDQTMIEKRRINIYDLRIILYRHDFTGIQEITINPFENKLIAIYDLVGRKVNYIKKNELYFFLYNNGLVEKKIILQ
jgi:hypothetical protein